MWIQNWDGNWSVIGLKSFDVSTSPAYFRDSIFLIRSTVMKHVSVKALPVLNGAVTQTARRPRASRRTGGKLIMWKMRAWKASIGVGAGADEGSPPCTRRSWPDWEQDQHRGPPVCLPASPLSSLHSHNSIIHPVFLPKGKLVAPPAFFCSH